MKGDARTRAGDRGRVSDAAHVIIVDGDLSRALRTFGKQCDRAGLFRELKRRQSFIPPSERRRLKSRRARKRETKTATRRSSLRDGRLPQERDA